MGELEGLRAELEECNSALQAKEMDVRMIKEGIPGKVKELEQNSAERGERKSRLRSFLAGLEKEK